MGRFIGHRGPQDDEWSWEPTSEPPRGGRGRRLPLAIAFAVTTLGVVIVAVALLLLSSSDDGSANGVPGSPSPTGTPVKTPAPSPTATRTVAPTVTAEPTASSTATPVPTASPTQGSSTLWVWSRTAKAWLQDSLTAQQSDYHEGQAIPVMLRIDDATVGQTYRVQIRYDCRAGNAAGIDFLTDGGGDAVTGAQAAPGPGRAGPDASAIIGDDPSITFDDGAQGSLSVWGGTFASAPEGPLPESACQKRKLVEFNLRAVDKTVYVIWAGHAASSAQWPQGGSSTAPSIVLEGTLAGSSPHQVTIEAGAIAP